MVKILPLIENKFTSMVIHDIIESRRGGAYDAEDGCYTK